MPTICIIDDDQQTADMLAEFVRLIGFDVFAFTSAEAFFKDYATHCTAVALLLDLNMPDMDGIEVMRRLAAHGNAPPLFLISGYDKGVLHSAEYLAKEHALKIIATLSKPIRFNQLQEILQVLLTNTDTELVVKRTTQRVKPTAAELEFAINNNQLVLHYQPQVNMRTGELTGIEALARWQHPEHGLIYPDAFISLAENNNLMGALTAQVIKIVVEQTTQWKQSGFTPQVSINISAENITSLLLPEQLAALMSDNHLDPSILTLEVTESALMGELVTSLDILTRIRMKGIKLSIDDFGTGYSSLSQLHRIPFTELKIDKSFVMQMAQESEARAIVKTCIMLGHELNMHVVAEGIENKIIYNLLLDMGCDIGQGYYIARPMPADALLKIASKLHTHL